VTLGQDAQGNAILTFPGGEALVLEGVSPALVQGKQAMAQIGIPCFATGTRVLTPTGEVAVEHLRAGMTLRTLDQGDQPILWAGGRQVDAAALACDPRLGPIRIAAGAMGNRGDLWLSPQHGVLVAGHLIRARHLADWGVPGVAPATVRRIGYHHLLLPRHALLVTQGIGTESLYPGAMTAAALALRDWAALCRLIPAFARAADDPEGLARAYGPRARPLLSRSAAFRLLGGRAHLGAKGRVPATRAPGDAFCG
jgi:Hint domain